MKCDETRPYCKRCLSAKRICGGYNIIIDVPRRKLQENSYLDCKNRIASIQPKPTTSPDSLPSLDPMEYRAFEHFRSNTVPELAGLRSAEFWRCIILPASYSEPAILHASLALSYAHKFRAEQKSGRNQLSSHGIRTAAFAEYNKAIRFLNERIVNHEHASSLRVILITCMMFIVLELFGGCLDKAMIHLRGGRQLLFQLGLSLKDNITGIRSGSETRSLCFATSPNRWKTSS